jgi:hypothetical protein
LSDITLVLESVDTDSIATAETLRLIVEGPANKITDAADMVLDGFEAVVTKATNILADGSEFDILARFVPEQIDPLDTGDAA